MALWQVWLSLTLYWHSQIKSKVLFKVSTVYNIQHRLWRAEEPLLLAIVRDSSAVRRLFVRLAGAVGRQSALHKENSRFVAPTPGRHISTSRGYQILFSIRNPYIASCYRFSCYYWFSDIAINSVNPSFIWRLEFSKNG